MRDRTILVMVLAVIVTGWGLGMPIATAEDQQEEGRGAVFVMTNSTDRVRGIEVVMYARDRDGTLTLVKAHDAVIVLNYLRIVSCLLYSRSQSYRETQYDKDRKPTLNQVGALQSHLSPFAHCLRRLVV